MPKAKTPSNSSEEKEDPLPQPSPGFTPNPEGRSKQAINPDQKELPPEFAEPIPPMTPPMPLSESEARTWAMLAHLSVLLNLVTGFLGVIASLIIFFIYKERSRFVAYHAMQAFIFQSITWIGVGILAGIFFGLGSALAFLIIPLLCFVPGFLVLLLTPISLVYGIIGGVKVNNGEDFRYWLVGDWVRDILKPKPAA